MSRRHACMRLSQTGSLVLIAWLAGSAPNNAVAMQEVVKSPMILHRLLFDAKNPELVLSVPAGVAVVENSPQDSEGIVASYHAAEDGSVGTYRSDSKLHIVSIGPLLDQPDRVGMRALTRNDNRFALTMVYTSARLHGEEMRKNIVWRPVVQVLFPVRLAPGRYRVEVTWQAVESLPDGEALGTPPLALSALFQIDN